MKNEHTTDEFTGNVKVTVSEKEVRVWVCDERGCQFRFKAMGKVAKSGGMDVMVIAKDNSHDELLAACEETVETVRRYDNGEIEQQQFMEYIRSRADECKAAITNAKKGAKHGN